MEKQEDCDVDIAGMESFIYKEIIKKHTQCCQLRLSALGAQKSSEMNTWLEEKASDMMAVGQVPGGNEDYKSENFLTDISACTGLSSVCLLCKRCWSQGRWSESLIVPVCPIAFLLLTSQLGIYGGRVTQEMVLKQRGSFSWGGTTEVGWWGALATAWEVSLSPSQAHHILDPCSSGLISTAHVAKLIPLEH